LEGGERVVVCDLEVGMHGIEWGCGCVLERHALHEEGGVVGEDAGFASEAAAVEEVSGP
jgi:hypothetical protein